VLLIDIVFSSFLPDCGVHCRFSHTLSLTLSVYTLLSKLTWHGRAEYLSRGPRVQG
jgi:hypothetical protein